MTVNSSERFYPANSTGNAQQFTLLQNQPQMTVTQDQPQFIITQNTVANPQPEFTVTGTINQNFTLTQPVNYPGTSNNYTYM